MKNETNKDFNKKLNDSKNMPKIVILDDDASKKWGGKTMVVAPPIQYDTLIKKIPFGNIITTSEIRKEIARINKTDITCPLTAGIFINICAWASYQRQDNITPYWRVLKANGELNNRYPEGINLQKELLEKEGHTIIIKGKNKNKYYVKDYENMLFIY